MIRALLLHSFRDLHLIPGLVAVCVEFAHSVHVCIGILPQYKDAPVRLIDHAKIYPFRVMRCVEGLVGKYVGIGG